MKVVINSCFGGFGLSREAYKRIGEIMGKPVIFLVDNRGLSGVYELSDGSSIFESAFFGSSADEINSKLPDVTHVWHTMSDEEKEENNRMYTELSVPDFSEDRSNPILIQVIEELGSDADGMYAKLKIIDIPDDVKFYIHEYDGLESIHENHRSWD